MARIAGVSAGDAGREVERAYSYTRRSLAQLTGRETERMIEPLEMYAHAPGLLRGYGMLEQATAELDRVGVVIECLELVMRDRAMLLNGERPDRFRTRLNG